MLEATPAFSLKIRFYLPALFFLFFNGAGSLFFFNSASFAAEAPRDEIRLALGKNWGGRVIDEIRFDRSGLYEEAELYDLIGFRPGEVYRTRLSREAVMRLYETGRFESVWISLSDRGEKAVVLHIHWRKKRLMKSIRFSNNRVLSDEALSEVVSVQPGTWFSDRIFEDILSNIRTRYRQAGYFQAKVAASFKTSPDDPKGVDVVIAVEEGLRTRIRKVRFNGKTVFSDLRLGLKIYSNASEYYLFDELEKDILRLKAFYEEKGYFRVVIGPVGVNHDETSNEVDIDITIQAHEQLSLFFEGDTLYKRKILESLLLIQKERSVAPGVLEGSAEAITRFYISEGYPLAKTRLSPEPEFNPDRIAVYFSIESGPRAIVKDIRFSGHYAFLNKVLLRQIALSPSSLLNKVYFTQDALEKDARALTLFYREQGFKNVVVKPKVDWNDAKTEARLLFEIDEGVRTRIRSIEIEGNTALDTKTLNKALPIEVQMPFTLAKMREGRRALLSRYARKGFLRAEITSELHFSLDQTDALLRYHVTEGPQTFFGDIRLEGNQFTQDFVILRELRVKTGEPYDPGAILKSQQHLYKTGFFSSVRLDPVRDEAPDAVRLPEQGRNEVRDLKISVTEKPRIALDFGVGYADRERTRGIIEITHNNLLGSGQSVSARLQRSRVEERYFLIYRKPWFFDESITGRITASYLDLQEVAFDLETFSIVAGVEKTFSPRLTGALLYQIERKQTSNVAPKAVQADEDKDRFIIGSFNPSFIYDTRHDPFNPRSGSVTSLVFRDAAKILGSEVQLLKVTLQHRSYHALSKNWVFAFSGRFGVAERFGETERIPIAERFFAGGRNTVRGYDEDELGVLGATFIDGAPTGGNAMFILNEELRYALPKSFGLVFFLDHGNVWERYQEIALSEVKSTVGMGLRYNTPIGPFRLDWGYKLNREGDESPSLFHFTLGHAF